MKIIAFAGSTSSTSINRQLVEYVVKKFKNAEVEILDLNDYEMPLFSIDVEKELGAQPKAKEFLAKLKSADLLVISLAEHNGSYSTAFKNILDWASRIDGNVFQGKPMLLMASSDGSRGGKAVLEAAEKKFPFLGAKIKATFSFPEFYENFERERGIINPELEKQVSQKVEESLKA